jgi:hypothetical protein
MRIRPKVNETSARGQRAYSRTPLNTYYRSKDQPAQSPFKKKQPKKNHRKFLIGAVDISLVVLLLAGVIYSLLLNAQPRVTVSGLSYHSLSTYQSQVAASFSGLKNRSKITFDERGVIAKIQHRFPEVQSAQIELPFFSQQPRVNLSVSPPAFKLSDGKQLYIMDAQGLAVARAADLPKLDKLVTITDQSGFEASVGKQLLSSESVSFINTVIVETQRAKVPIASLTLPPLAQEIDLRTVDQPYFVKFYLGGDALTQTGQFLAARQKFAQTHQTPADYLDVRIAGKIFYK